MSQKKELELTAEQLRWQCDTSWFDREGQPDSDSVTDVIGQQTARDALNFGLLCDAPGQNIYVRVARGTGRRTLVKNLLKELAPKTDSKRDFCYVHHFKNPDRPRLITLRAGQAKAFRKQIHDIAKFIESGLMKALDSEPFASERTQMKAEYQAQIAAISQPLESDLAENEMALVSIQQGNMSVPVIFPLVEGNPVKPEQFQDLIKEGKASQEQLDKFKAMFPEFQKRLQEVGKRVNEVYREGHEAVEQFNERGARSLF